MFKHNAIQCSFEIERKDDSAKVAKMHDARAGKISDVIGEATKALVKSKFKGIIDSRVCNECVGRCRGNVGGNRRVWNFLQLLTVAYNYEFSFRVAQP